MGKFTDFIDGDRGQIKQIDVQISISKKQKIDLQQQIDELQNALENEEKEYKWFELKEEVSDKRDLKNALKSAQIELKRITKNLAVLEKDRKKLDEARKKRRIGIYSGLAMFMILFFVTTIGLITEKSNPNATTYTTVESKTEIAVRASTTQETITEEYSIQDTTTEVSTTQETSAKETTATSTVHYDSSKETVYITNSGTKYHRDGCRHLKSKYETTKKDAISKGYEPCGTCNPGW